MTWSNKKDTETLDYSLDWTYRLPSGDRIANSSWTVTANLTIIANSYSNTLSTVWLANGTPGVATVTNTVGTVGGRVFVEEVLLKIV